MGLKNGSNYEIKDIYDPYVQTIEERGGEDERSEKNLKKYLKTLLLQEIEGIVFEKSVQRNKSEKVYSSLINDIILDASISKILENKIDNFKAISKAAKIIRASCLMHIRSSDNKYDNTNADNTVPIELSSMVRWKIS